MLWHILAPRAVACDYLHLRASVQLWHVSAFLCNGEFLGISCYIKIPGYTRRGPCSKNPLFMLFPEKFRKFTDSPFSPPPSPDASPVQPSSQLRRRPGPGVAAEAFSSRPSQRDVAAELSVLIHVDSNVDQHSSFLLRRTRLTSSPYLPPRRECPLPGRLPLSPSSLYGTQSPSRFPSTSTWTADVQRPCCVRRSRARFPSIGISNAFNTSMTASAVHGAKTVLLSCKHLRRIHCTDSVEGPSPAGSSAPHVFH